MYVYVYVYVCVREREGGEADKCNLPEQCILCSRTGISSSVSVSVLLSPTAPTQHHHLSPPLSLSVPLACPLSPSLPPSRALSLLVSTAPSPGAHPREAVSRFRSGSQSECESQFCRFCGRVESGRGRPSPRRGSQSGSSAKFVARSAPRRPMVACMVLLEAFMLH